MKCMGRDFYQAPFSEPYSTFTASELSRRDVGNQALGFVVCLCCVAVLWAVWSAGL